MPAATSVGPTRILVLGMTHEDGSIDPSELDPVAEACGEDPDQVRSCLATLVKEGLLTRDGPLFRATDRGIANLNWLLDRTRLAYAQDAAGRGWDGKWRLVAFAVPDRRRSAREAFARHLASLGGATLQQGLLVSPRQLEEEALDVAERLHIHEVVTTITTSELAVGGVRDPKELAKLLWPVEEVEKRYERFLARHERVMLDLDELRKKRERLPDSAYLPTALAMAVEFQQIFVEDPLLPPELLPRPWPGRAARDLLVRSRRLAVSLRETSGGPALFRTYIDAVERLP